MAYRNTHVLIPSGPYTGSGVSPAFNTVGSDEIHVMLSVSSYSGAGPKLNVHVEWSMDRINWGRTELDDSFSEKATAGSTIEAFNVKAPLFRIAYAVSVGASFTFSTIVYTTH